MYPGQLGSLLLELVNDHVDHALTHIRIKMCCHTSTTFTTYTNLTVIADVLRARESFLKWVACHKKGYRRRYRLFMGPRRTLKNDDTPIM